MKSISFVRTIVQKDKYADKVKMGGVYILHFDPVLSEGTEMYACVECSVPVDEYDADKVKAAYEEWKTKQEVSKLAYAIRKKKEEIEAFDKSSSVNEFLLNGTHRWLDAELRRNISYAASILSQKGEDSIDIWFGTEKVSMSCDKALDILNQVEVYAKQTNNVTHQHLATVESMKTVEEVENFDVTSDYPPQLELTV